MVEPAYGPLDLPFLVIYAALFGIVMLAAALVLGSILLLPPVNRLWYQYPFHFWIVLATGLIVFLSGAFIAHQAFFTSHQGSAVAEGHLLQVALPGGLCVVAALCFIPIGRGEPATPSTTKPEFPEIPGEGNLDRYLRRREAERRGDQSKK